MNTLDVCKLVCCVCVCVCMRPCVCAERERLSYVVAAVEVLVVCLVCDGQTRDIGFPSISAVTQSMST